MILCLVLKNNVSEMMKDVNPAINHIRGPGEQGGQLWEERS